MTPGGPTPLDGPTLDAVEALLREETGLTLAGEVRGSLSLAVGAAAEALGVPVDALAARLLRRDGKAVAAFIDHAVVPETYFFRHPEHFRALAGGILPALADRASLRLWSAGCATGEEPYSLAIALLEAGRTPGVDRVLGTDVSTRLLEKAREGRYGRWSFRHVGPGVLGRHFVAAGAAFEITGDARRTVAFRQHNLIAEPAALEGCDLVVCRNVLIYFAPELAREVVARLAGAVRPGGWLLLGPAELPLARGLDVEPVEVGGATALRRLEPGAGSRPEARRPVARRPLPQAPARAPAAAGPVASPPTPPSAGAVPPTVPPVPSVYDRAVVAAQTGRLDEALCLAREAAREPAAPPHLLLALLADATGDDETALVSIRRALYLDPDEPLAHATLARLHDRGGRPEEARRSRANAVGALAPHADDDLLPGPFPMTAGALRRALGIP